MPSTERPAIVLSARRAPNPWSIPTGIATVFTALVLAGLIASVAAGQYILAIAPAVLLVFGVWFSYYTNTRRTHPENLLITADAVEYVAQADRGLALSRPRSRVSWSDVTGLGVVTWHARPWLGVRTRPGAQLTGSAWTYFAELDLDLFVSLDTWDVPRDQLVSELRHSGEAAGAAWLGELEAAKV